MAAQGGPDGVDGGVVPDGSIDSLERIAEQNHLKPPYRPENQALGGMPSILPDIPVSAVFLALFTVGAVGHMVLLKRNQKRGKKFIFNGMIFGFCMTRIFATTMRIVWATDPRKIPVGIAAMIFVYAGIVLLFIANLFFAQRIVRAQHPSFGWSKPFTLALPITIVLIIATIFCLIAAVVVQFYVLGGQQEALDIQRFGSTFFAVISFLPIPIVAISCLARAHPKIRKTKTVDKFGEGTMRAKIAIVLVSAFFLCVGATYRSATMLMDAVPLMSGPEQSGPPAPLVAHLSKPAFYVFNFTIEICIVFFWLAVRIDKRFHVPDGAKGPGSYGNGFIFAGEAGNEKTRSTRHLVSSRSSLHVGEGRSRRSSMASSRVESRVSWGGVSRDNILPMYAEDGVGMVPYSAIDHDQHQPEQGDLGIEGAEQEMGWDPKSGKWALRPISRTMTMSSGSQPPTWEEANKSRCETDDSGRTICKV